MELGLSSWQPRSRSVWLEKADARLEHAHQLKHRGVMSVGFAYFIMVHQLPLQFEQLFDAIYDPNDLFLVHVDLKSRLGLKAERRGVYKEVRRVCAGKHNVRILRSRFTNWGGWSLSKILLHALSVATKRDKNWRYFVNLSGQCLPLKAIADIKREIMAAGEVVYVEMLPIKDLPEDDWHHRNYRMFETPVRARILRGRQADPEGFTLTCKGSQWVILPRDFCDWVVKAPIVRRISAYLCRRLLSDELIMQALVENGPFRSKLAPHYGREIMWPGPKIFTMADRALLGSSRAWFARKFDSRTDSEVIDWLRSKAGKTTTPATAA